MTHLMRRGFHWLAVSLNATLLALMITLGTYPEGSTPLFDFAVGALLMMVTPISLAALLMTRPAAQPQRADAKPPLSD